MPSALRLDLFCRVVDNYGDIGICWRLARQLQQEHAIAVTLWVDDLASFHRICPQVALDAALQVIDGVTVRHWRDQDGVFGAAEVADIVIEFFAVDIPPGYIEAMAQRAPRPVWLNLEGLTAEEWVEGCHTLPSTHPRLPLVKHFYFPGFNSKTGGLLREAGLTAQRDAFQADPAAQGAFLAQWGVTAAEAAAIKVSLFCYPHAPVAALLAAWQAGATPVTCLVPEGVASDAIGAFMATADMGAGAVATRGALTVRVLPFMPQADYDKLLWACDLNLVRGEDSFVRAQWAAKPFAWHIYPQDENLHHKKLRAFLHRYADGLPALSAFSLAWNGAGAVDWPAQWPAFFDEMPTMAARAGQWERQMHDNGDLASNLLAFSGIMLGS
jgi:uncharacterized repeat protein (TIGR03837 family)